MYRDTKPCTKSASEYFLYVLCSNLLTIFLQSKKEMSEVIIQSSEKCLVDLCCLRSYKICTYLVLIVKSTFYKPFARKGCTFHLVLYNQCFRSTATFLSVSDFACSLLYGGVQKSFKIHIILYSFSANSTTHLARLQGVWSLSVKCT